MGKAKMRILVVGICFLVALSGLILLSSNASKISGGTLIQRSAPATILAQADKSKQKNQPDGPRTLAELRSRYPRTDYDAPETSDPSERAKRTKRNKHYDGNHLVTTNPDDSTTAVTEISEVFLNLPALPVSESDVILTADLLNSEAHLSNNRNAVYSEFSVRVEEVLKGAVPTLTQSNLISVSRLGGIVHYPSGKQVLYAIAHQHMPATRRRYLFFLKADRDAEVYEILTAYEMTSEQVLPLDGGANFETYSGTDPSSFLNKVRDAIARQN